MSAPKRERFSVNTRKVEEYIKRIKRRKRFLEQRIEDRDDSNKAHYDRSELSAITWMIRYVEDTILEAADHQNKWFEEQEHDYDSEI